MRKLIFIYFLALSFSGTAQDSWKESTLDEFTKAIMVVESKIPDNSSYSFETDYSFYGGLETDIPEMEMSANLICSKGKEIYINQFGRIITQNQVLNVISDTASREIIISDSNPQLFTKKTTSDFATLYATKCKVEKKISGNQTAYYLGFPEGFSYIGAEVWIQNSKQQVSKYVLYSNREVNIEKDGNEISVQPRLEVKYKNFTYGANVVIAKMKHVHDFVTKDASGNYVVSDEYSDYQLIDLRTTN